MDAIFTRRSIRKFKSDDVPPGMVEYLLRAAMSAPSAGNQQPWHFIVVRDRVTLEKVTKIHQYAAMMNEAPVAILVCGDLELEKHEGFWMQDCSAATENILIAAESKGLGAVWVGVYPRNNVDAFQQLFALPGNVIPLCAIAVGWPAEKKPPADRYDEKRIHHEKW